MSDIKMSEIDYHIQQIADYVAASGLNFSGATFDCDGEELTVTISKSNWASNLKEENKKLREALSKVQHLVCSYKDNADMTVTFEDGDFDSCLTSGDIECLEFDIQDIIDNIGCES